MSNAAALADARHRLQEALQAGTDTRPHRRAIELLEARAAQEADALHVMDANESTLRMAAIRERAAQIAANFFNEIAL